LTQRFENPDHRTQLVNPFRNMSLAKIGSAK
jgi:hypothetical protein